MADSGKLKGITTMEGGRIHVQFGQEGRVYEDLDAIRREVAATLNPDVLRALLLGWWLSRDSSVAMAADVTLAWRLLCQ